MKARYRLNYEKILEAIVWLAENYGPIDAFHIAKTFFYADKIHLNRYGRPVLGDQYVAMKDGPVPSKAYDFLKRDYPFVGAAELREIESAIAFEPDREYAVVTARRPANTDYFSESDMECLSEAAELYAVMPFRNLWDKVHAEPAFNLARSFGGNNPPIDFELMVDADNPEREAILSEIEEDSGNLAL